MLLEQRRWFKASMDDRNLVATPPTSSLPTRASQGGRVDSRDRFSGLRAGGSHWGKHLKKSIDARPHPGLLPQEKEQLRGSRDGIGWFRKCRRVGFVRGK